MCRWLGPAHQVGQVFCSYFILDNAEYIARSSVIGIDQPELSLDFMKDETSKFMTSMESIIGNNREGVFKDTAPSAIYYDAFGEDTDADDNVLPYGNELIGAKTETIAEAYLEALDTYIGAEIVIPDCEAVPVLTKVKKQK